MHVGWVPDGAGGYTWGTGRSDAPAQLGTWVHLVGTFDASPGQARLYVDGQVQSINLLDLDRACDLAAESFDRRQRERFIGGERLRACARAGRERWSGRISG